MRTLGVSVGVSWLLMSALSACTGAITGDGGELSPAGRSTPTGTPADGPNAGQEGSCAEELNPAPMRRVTAYEAAPLLAALLGVPAPTAKALPDDSPNSRGYLNSASVQVLHPSGVERMVDLVMQLSDTATSAGTLPPDFRHCTDPGFDACVEQALPRFLRHAFRRPATAEETAPLLQLFRAEGSNRASFRLMLQAALLMPRAWFIARQLHTGQGPGQGAHDVAERLALLLWGSVPDAQLESLADSGALLKSEVLRAEVSRLLKDPASDRFVQQFADQWLGLSALEAIDTTRETRFDGLPSGILDDMRAQAVELVRYVAASGQPISQLLLSSALPLKQSLSPLVSAERPLSVSTAFEMVTVPAPRVGLFGTSAILTLSSDDTRTSVVQRGIKFSKKFSCLELPPPPASVQAQLPAFTETPDGKPLPAYEAAAKRLAAAACQGCHTRIDPVGLSLEAFDPIGRYRTKYADGSSVFAAGNVAGTEVLNYVSNAEALATSDAFGRCVLDNLGAYLSEQDLGLTKPDTCKFKQAIAQAAPSTPLRDLVIAFVADPDFLKL